MAKNDTNPVQGYRHPDFRFGEWMFISATTLLLCNALIPRCSAQSMVIDAGNDLNLKNFVGQSMPVDSVPSDLSPSVRATESRLAMPTPANWRNEMQLTELIEAMNAAGIPVCLHESAVDNNLDFDQQVRLALHNASLGENLRFMLETFECDLAIDNSGRITIASEDYLCENPITVTFDITNIRADVDPFIELIEETVDPDSWEVNGGNGRMRFLEAGQRTLLTVTTTWRNISRVRRLISSIHGMSRTGDIASSSRRGPLSGGSTILELPYHPGSSHSPYERAYWRGYGNSGQGFGGGAGLGGGVF